MSDDWNSDGLNDNWDEAHEFGIDLDGGGGIAGSAEDAEIDDGFDLAFLALFDAADLLGAELIDLPGFTADLAAETGSLLEVEPRALPFGDGFVSLLEQLGDGGLPTEQLLAHIAALELTNPFPSAVEAIETPDAT